MDVFKFNNIKPLSDGEIINGLTSKMWVERYRDAGEFTFVAPASLDIINKLPIGSFVSHIDSQEVMIVENHEISETKDGKSEITITGRSFETLLENRIVGSNKVFPIVGILTDNDYLVRANYIYVQAVTLISDHIIASDLLDDNYAFPYVTVTGGVVDIIDGGNSSVNIGYSDMLDGGSPSSVASDIVDSGNAGATPTIFIDGGNSVGTTAVVDGGTAYTVNTDIISGGNAKSTIISAGTAIDRYFPRKSVYTCLLELLSSDNLGVKNVRPGIWSSLEPSVNIGIVIHKGADRTGDIILSWDDDQIVSADYLWSNKFLKNAALVTGTYIETLINESNNVDGGNAALNSNVFPFTYIGQSDVMLGGDSGGVNTTFVDGGSASTTNVPTGYDRRVMHVDAKSSDGFLTGVPTGGWEDFIIPLVETAGFEALASQNKILITKAEVSKNATLPTYRTDYEIGDLITIRGNYGVVSAMRVIEYVEIEDASGESGYPTLSID